MWCRLGRRWGGLPRSHRHPHAPAGPLPLRAVGEIIPQAICSKHALMIGYHTTWIVKVSRSSLAEACQQGPAPSTNVGTHAFADFHDPIHADHLAHQPHTRLVAGEGPGYRLQPGAAQAPDVSHPT